MEDNTESGLQKLTDSLGDIMTGIPAPVRKNFFKAFSQLCTAAVDIPVALLESKASEIRALTEARIQIIRKEGEGISEEIKVPKEYISKASSKYASKIIKEQINLDQITLNAANELSSKVKAEDGISETEISDDWLNEFENQAKLKSSDDMKLIFGKILSGEISKPGTFSIRAVKLISQLDNQAAILFQLFCSICVSMRIREHIFDARVVSVKGDAAANSLQEFGLTFDNLNILHEYGLIISDYNSYMKYTTCIVNENNMVSMALSFGNKQFCLVPTDKEKYDKNLQLHGIALTKSGKELFDIIPKTNNTTYTNALVEYFYKKHLQLTEIGSA